jgi:hypothetical protein
LNRPERLRDLAVLNFDRLGLMPMEPHQFGRGTEVAYPPPPALVDSVSDLAIEAPVDVSGTLNADPEVQSP